jgi:hypothetical protein
MTTQFETEHKTKLIQFGDWQAKIDEDIADLVLNLWELGLITLNSCQDNVPKGFVWIEFRSALEAERFLNFVSEYSEEPGSVYDRMTREWGDATALDWIYTLNLSNLGVEHDPVSDDEILPRFTGRHAFHFSMSVRFPRQDLEFVKKQISKEVYKRNALSTSLKTSNRRKQPKSVPAN